MRKHDIVEFEFRNSIQETEIKEPSFVTVEVIPKMELVDSLCDYFQDINTKAMLENLIDPQQFSDLHRLLRDTAYVFRFAHRVNTKRGSDAR